MAPAGRGALRPYQPSKFQPFLIVCLLVTVVVVGYNFWTQMKRNSVLLVEIGRIQTTLRRVESERKECKNQLASKEDQSRQHENEDKEKENTLEDTRRVVEDLKSEKNLLKQNISKLLVQITSSEFKEDKSRSECDQRCETMRTEVQNTCVRDKEKIQQEMNDRLDVMRNQLLRYQETENSGQKLQKQEAGNDTAARQGDSTAQLEQKVPRRDDVEPVQQQQQQQELPMGQRYRKSRLSNNQLRRDQLSDDRLHGKQQDILTYRSKEARSRNSQNDELLGHHGNDEVIYSKQTGTGRHPQANFSSAANEISGIDRQQQLNRENENGEDAQKGEREAVATEKSVVVDGESAPNAEGPDPGQNSELSEGKRLKLSQESEMSNTLSQRLEGQDQDQSLKNPDAEAKENDNKELDQAANQKLPSQGSLQSQRDEGNPVENDNRNLPERTDRLHQDNGDPSQD